MAPGGGATRVLVVDDEANLVELVQGYLERDGYDVLTAGDGQTALALTRDERPDLIILDLMLPGIDGLEVCRRVRQFSDAYILMLTARAEEVDKVVGLSVGADDYLTKPFSPRELIARVRAMLRRPRSGSAEPDPPAPRRLGDLVVDAARFEVRKRGEPIALTARELSLLATLAAHPGHVFTRAQLLEKVWGSALYDDHVVDVNIGNLRRKLEDDPARPRWVQTVRGVGYRLARTGMNVLRRAVRGLHARLLLAHLLVIAVGLVTVYAAASFAAPRFFERNMLAQARRAMPQPPQTAVARPSQRCSARPPSDPGPGRLGIMSAELEQRVTEIYLDSLADSLLLAGGVALATAAVASVLVSAGSPARSTGWPARAAASPPATTASASRSTGTTEVHSACDELQRDGNRRRGRRAPPPGADRRRGARDADADRHPGGVPRRAARRRHRPLGPRLGEAPRRGRPAPSPDRRPPGALARRGPPVDRDLPRHRRRPRSSSRPSSGWSPTSPSAA